MLAANILLLLLESPFSPVVVPPGGVFVVAPTYYHVGAVAATAIHPTGQVATGFHPGAIVAAGFTPTGTIAAGFHPGSIISTYFS